MHLAQEISLSEQACIKTYLLLPVKNILSDLTLVPVEEISLSSLVMVLVPLYCNQQKMLIVVSLVLTCIAMEIMQRSSQCIIRVLMQIIGLEKTSLLILTKQK